MKFEQKDIIRTKSLSDFRTALLHTGYSKTESNQVANIYSKVENQHYRRFKQDFFGNKLHGVLYTNNQVLKSDFQAVHLQNEAIRYMAFVGLKSKRTPKDTAKYIRAVKLDKEGVPMRKIYLQTGWYKSIYDNKWRFEISDRDAKIRYEVVTENKQSQSKTVSKFGNRGEIDPKTKFFVLKEDGFKFRNLLDHPTLYKYYPEFAEYKVEGFLLGQDIFRDAYFDMNSKTIFVADWDEKNAIKSIMHEVQHAIQRIEGFSFGNNLMFGLMIKEKGIEWTQRAATEYKNIHESIQVNPDTYYKDTVKVYLDIIKKYDNFNTDSEKGCEVEFSDFGKRLENKYNDTIVLHKDGMNNTDLIKSILSDLGKFRFYIEEKILSKDNEVICSELDENNLSMVIAIKYLITEYIQGIIKHHPIEMFCEYMALQSAGHSLLNYANSGNFPNQAWIDLYKESFKIYDNTAGEIESRLVEDRIEFDELKRKLSYPLKSTPDKSQVTNKYFQKSNIGIYVRGATQFDKNDTAIMYFTGDKNITTPIHELGHILEKCLTHHEKSKVDKWLESQKPNIRGDAFAMGFEKYIMQESNNVNQALKENINAQYPSKLKEIELNDDIKRVYKSLTGI